MMSELVAVSAWICPPVAAPLEVAVPPTVLPGVDTGALAMGCDALVMPAAAFAPLMACPLIAARNLVANFVASAFLRYTTWMLPLALVPLG